MPSVAGRSYDPAAAVKTSQFIAKREHDQPGTVNIHGSGLDTNLAIWPSRTSWPVKRIKTNAPDPDDYTKKTPPVYDVKSKTVSVPLNDSAYDRTVRLNAALHAIYSTKTPTTHLDEALEEARLHMLLARTTGTPRRDELNTALRDLRNTRSLMSGLGPGPDMAMLTTVRALAMLRGGGCKNPERIDKLIDKKVAKYLKKGAIPAIHKALDALEADQFSEKAKTILQPYFQESVPPPPCQFPMAGKTQGDRPIDMPMSGLEGLQAVADGVISNESADMLSPSTVAQLLKEPWLPKMEIVKLTDVNSIRTCFGIVEKTAMSGIKIKAKKLALIVGPNLPRIFTKPIDRENGGCVLIDASGSMGMSNEMLKTICDLLPMATVAYYDSRSDNSQHRPDKLHVYSEKGLRSTVTNLPRMAGGNMIDFPAIQWLLKQPGPRWFLTDGGFTGPEGAVMAAHELSKNAHKRKIIKMVSSIDIIIKDIEKKKGKL